MKYGSFVSRPKNRTLTPHIYLYSDNAFSPNRIILENPIWFIDRPLQLSPRWCPMSARKDATKSTHSHTLQPHHSTLIHQKILQCMHFKAFGRHHKFELNIQNIASWPKAESAFVLRKVNWIWYQHEVCEIHEIVVYRMGGLRTNVCVGVCMCVCVRAFNQQMIV